MNISRTAFVLLFLIFASAVIFGGAFLLDQLAESLVATGSETGWKNSVSVTLYPVKVALMGPVLPITKLLHQDPDTPPPYILAVYFSYRTIFALIVHKFIRKR